MRTIVILLAAMIIMVMGSFTPKTQLIVTSPAFSNNGMIPRKYSCTGLNYNPPLHIANIPKNAKSLAIIVHDPDAPIKGGFTHWVVWNIDVSSDIPEHFKGGEQGFNGAKRPGYTGMCPPSGTHHYHFYVYALDMKLSIVEKDTDKGWLETLMQGHVIAEGDLVGLYQK